MLESTLHLSPFPYYIHPALPPPKQGKLTFDLDVADIGALLRLRLRVEADVANHGHDAVHEIGRGAEVEVVDDDACQVVDLEDCERHVFYDVLRWG